jgi:RNA polymerase sigma factor (sigma-70 family)
VLYTGAVDGAALANVARDAAAGDAKALARLLDELAPLVVRTTRLIVGPGTFEAEDAAQEALADLARAITKLRDPNAVVAWAGRIATRRALRAARWERLRGRRECELSPSLTTTQPGEDRRLALNIAFDRLPQRRRAIAVLRLYLGLSEAETADALGTSIGAVKSQLHQARRQLARSLRDAGFAPATSAAIPTKGTL